MSYGPALNAAAILLAAFGNVPEPSAHLIGMLLGMGMLSSHSCFTAAGPGICSGP